MSDNNNFQLNLVLYWHMHQPEYRDLSSGKYNLPWTYLHTIKDYVDMVTHLENNSGAHAVVNFAPVLLEQIDDYAQQLNDYLNHGKSLRDPLLAALADPALSLEQEQHLDIIKACLRANEERLVNRFEIFKSLTEMAEVALHNPEILPYYSQQFFVDILLWYHIAWIAETVRMSEPRIIGLMAKKSNFDNNDRHIMVELISEIVSGVIERYKKLADSGQIELSMTPYAHPIVPLLIDIKSTSQAMPESPLPDEEKYPDGLARSRWHMQKGIEVFKHYFNREPHGCWPSEGSVSADTITLISEMGFKWLASGETVLRNSIHKSEIELGECIHQAYQYRDNETTCFFRDDGLSDLIGFKYSDWHADDAVANLVNHLEDIAEKCSDKPDSIVSIILDGENAWEYYPQNGYHFISALYEKLSKHPTIKLTTYSKYLDKHKYKITLNEIVAGSWVFGTFSTWIGEKDKNRAWDMLIEAKKVYDHVLTKDRLSNEQKELATMQLATCESSDWFWWFGEYNSAESVAAFDLQYRLHLNNLYKLLNVEAPEYLNTPFSFGSADPVLGGTMLPGQQL